MIDALFLMEPDYSLAYALVGLLVLLGVLAMCLPRPRKTEVPPVDS
jgi:hypothetical protein